MTYHYELPEIVGHWVFDADHATVDGGGYITQVNDVSGQNNHLTQSVQSAQAQLAESPYPESGAVFGRGGQAQYYTADFPASGTITLIAVAMAGSNAQYNGQHIGFGCVFGAASSSRRAIAFRRGVSNAADIMGMWHDGAWRSGAISTANLGLSIISFQQADDSLRMGLDGYHYESVASAAMSSAVHTLMIGTSLNTTPNNEDFIGTIYEVIAFSGALTDQQTQDVIDELYLKYKVPVRASGPMVLAEDFPLASNVVAAYPLTDAPGSRTAADASGNGLHGVVGRRHDDISGYASLLHPNQGVAIVGGTTYQTSTTEISNGTITRNPLSDAAIQGVPDHLGGMCVYENEIYCAVSTYPSPQAADSQIAIFNTSTLVVDRIIDLSVHGPFDCSGVYVENAEVFVSGFSPAVNSGDIFNGIWVYDTAGNFLRRETFQLAPVYLQGLTRDSNGNWYFSVWNEDYSARNWILRYDATRKLTGAIAFDGIREIEDVDARGSSLVVSFRRSGFLVNASAHRAIPFDTFDTGATTLFTGQGAEFNAADADYPFIFLPLKFGESGSIHIKSRARTLFALNYWMTSLSAQGVWQSSYTATGAADFDIGTTVLDDVDSSPSMEDFTITWRPSHVRMYKNGQLVESANTTAGLHAGALILGAPSAAANASSLDVLHTVIFDKELSQEEVTDLVGRNFSIYESGSPNSPPEFSPLANQSGFVSTSVSVNLVATDPDEDTLTYSVDTLPAGLSLNTSTGAITGTYTASGVVTSTFTVTDGIASDTMQVQWTVIDTPNLPPEFEPQANVAGVVGNSVSINLVATDPDGDTLIFSVDTLPAGLSLNTNTGAITGTYTAAGVVTSTFTVSDGGFNDTIQVQWTVTAPANEPPALTQLANQTGQVGNSVSVNLVATDPDDDTLTYSVDTLPAGLSLNSNTGAITGTYTAAGVVISTFTVTDGTDSDTMSMQWTVSSAPSVDSVPDEFSFAPVTGANPLSQHSATATITGVDAGALLVVQGGELSNNNGASWGASREFVSGATQVRAAVTASNQFSSTSSAVVTVNGVSAVFIVTTRLPIPPAITVHPEPVTINEGASFVLSAAANNALEWRWHVNGFPIPGATSSTYQVTVSTPSHAGSYRATAIGEGGSIAQSNAALVSVIPNISPNDGNNDMSQGNVIINNLNLAQGDFPEIERKALFIGLGSVGAGELLSLNAQSDLDDLLGAADSEIKRNIVAARANGGERWMCYALPQDNVEYDWEEALDLAMETISPELIALCTPATSSLQIAAMQEKAELLRTGLARRVIIATATPGIDAETQTWAQYEAAQSAIVTGLAAYRVAAVPQLHGNDLGCVVGRLCNHSVSIADSPMRVATGPVLGLGETPVDVNGRALSGATLATLDSMRLSCIQRYPDYPGTYWGDMNLLDIPAGDYQVIENLRVIDKAARAVRVLAIARVANRSFNNTPVSIAANKTYFTRPLREMSHSAVFNGEHFPGEILPPQSDAIEILWPTRTEVEIYLKLQPYNAPKRITANLVLDLSGT